MTLRIFILLLSATCCHAAWSRTVVAEASTGSPLPHASVFDRNGHFAGVSDAAGRLPDLPESAYPLTLRYIGFVEQNIDAAGRDTVFMRENVTELPELAVETGRRMMLHILAYVREYSTLTSYTDTVFLFREKMVDFMLPTHPDLRRHGWKRPRVLSSKSYYRFTDASGLDSVSDRCSHHFSWTDWVGMPPVMHLPEAMRLKPQSSDTLRGRYMASEIWARNADRLRVDIDALADTAARRWLPSLRPFFSDNIDFEQLRVRYDYRLACADSVETIDLNAFSFNIDSRGRGHGMFLFHRKDDPFFVSTYAENYILDKEYITVKEARKWEQLEAHAAGLGIAVPPDAPDLQPPIAALVARVEHTDHDRVRLAMQADERLAGLDGHNRSNGLLQRLKSMFGIDHVVARRKWNRQWRDFRREQNSRNRGK